jgi:hypothetical protein
MLAPIGLSPQQQSYCCKITSMTPNNELTIIRNAAVQPALLPKTIPCVPRWRRRSTITVWARRPSGSSCTSTKCCGDRTALWLRVVRAEATEFLDRMAWLPELLRALSLS